MYTYKLPNGLTINAERLAEDVVLGGEFPQTYLDIETGALIEISSSESLGVWVKEIGNTKRYFLVERFTNDEKINFAREFVEVIMSIEASNVKQAQVVKILKTNSIETFEDFLESETDGWIHGWDQYIADEAWEYIHRWLTNNPHVKIEASFEGCGNCAICTTMKDGKVNNISDLLSAFNTEAVMQSVETQLKKRASDEHKIDSTKVASRTPPQLAFVFKVTLNHSKPAIWRRIVVSDNYTFYELHSAIQDAMGWLDYHLHSFIFNSSGKKDSKFGFDSVQTISLPHGDVEMFGPADIDESNELIKGWFGAVANQCIYTYDFGDSWDHTVVLEKVLPFDIQKMYPQCTAGKNACPPEDCGGVWGYKNIKEVLADSKHEEHTNMLEWLDLESADEFNPTLFDPTAIEFDDPKARLEDWQQQTET